MAFKSNYNLSPGAICLFTDYLTFNKWWEIKKRRNLKKKIYSIELPYIREQLLKIEDFEDLLYNKDLSRIYMDIIYEALNNQNLSLKKLNQMSDPDSFFSRFTNFQLKTIYNLLMNEKLSPLLVEKVIYMIKPFNIGYFTAITQTELDVFSYFKIADNERKNSRS